MATFVVQYLYSQEKSDMDGLRAEHRAYLRTLLDSGSLLASGPLVDRNGALLIFSADSPEDVALQLDSDPFEMAGFIGERIIEEWNPIMGPWSAQ
ncbi:MAG: YciI family protein [Micrococcales bacterium]